MSIISSASTLMSRMRYNLVDTDDTDGIFSSVHAVIHPKVRQTLNNFEESIAIVENETGVEIKFSRMNYIMVGSWEKIGMARTLLEELIQNNEHDIRQLNADQDLGSMKSLLGQTDPTWKEDVVNRFDRGTKFNTWNKPQLCCDGDRVGKVPTSMMFSSSSASQNSSTSESSTQRNKSMFRRIVTHQTKSETPFSSPTNEGIDIELDNQDSRESPDPSIDGIAPPPAASVQSLTLNDGLLYANTVSQKKIITGKVGGLEERFVESSRSSANESASSTFEKGADLLSDESTPTQSNLKDDPPIQTEVIYSDTDNGEKLSSGFSDGDDGGDYDDDDNEDNSYPIQDGRNETPAESKEQEVYSVQKYLKESGYFDAITQIQEKSHSNEAGSEPVTPKHSSEVIEHLEKQQHRSSLNEAEPINVKQDELSSGKEDENADSVSFRPIPEVKSDSDDDSDVNSYDLDGEGDELQQRFTKEPTEAETNKVDTDLLSSSHASQSESTKEVQKDTKDVDDDDDDDDDGDEDDDYGGQIIKPLYEEILIDENLYEYMQEYASQQLTAIKDQYAVDIVLTKKDNNLAVATITQKKNEKFNLDHLESAKHEFTTIYQNIILSCSEEIHELDQKVSREIQQEAYLQTMMKYPDVLIKETPPNSRRHVFVGEHKKVKASRHYFMKQASPSKLAFDGDRLLHLGNFGRYEQPQNSRERSDHDYTDTSSSHLQCAETRALKSQAEMVFYNTTYMRGTATTTQAEWNDNLRVSQADEKDGKDEINNDAVFDDMPPLEPISPDNDIDGHTFDAKVPEVESHRFSVFNNGVEAGASENDIQNKRSNSNNADDQKDNADQTETKQPDTDGSENEIKSDDREIHAPTIIEKHELDGGNKSLEYEDSNRLYSNIGDERGDDKVKIVSERGQPEVEWLGSGSDEDLNDDFKGNVKPKSLPPSTVEDQNKSVKLRSGKTKATKNKLPPPEVANDLPVPKTKEGLRKLRESVVNQLTDQTSYDSSNLVEALLDAEEVEQSHHDRAPVQRKNSRSTKKQDRFRRTSTVSLNEDHVVIDGVEVQHPHFAAKIQEDGTVANICEGSLCTNCTKPVHSLFPLDCGHQFCDKCIRNPRILSGDMCPECGKKFLRERHGQPEGRMSHIMDKKTNMPRFTKYGTLMITFNFPANEIEGDGECVVSYPQTNIVTFVPNNDIGRTLFKLYMEAYKQNKLFEVLSVRGVKAIVQPVPGITIKNEQGEITKEYLMDLTTKLKSLTAQ